MEDRIDPGHPLRALRTTVDRLLYRLSPTFDQIYSRIGRPSIPPEQLLKALLLQIIYSIRSERELVEHVNFNLLFRWFVGLSADAEMWAPSTFSKNRERLEQADVAAAFFTEVKNLADEHGLLSHEHFTVDGTLLEAAASLKSFRPKDEPPQPPATGGRNPTVNFHGETRSNETHASTTDPDARLARKGDGKEAKLCHLASTLIENRHGLVVAVDVRPPDGSAEVEAGVDLLTEVASPTGQRKTVGGDKGYDQAPFVDRARALDVTPHVAQRSKGSAIDGRTTRHAGYAISQWKRKLIEQGYGWGKTVGLLRKLRHRGQHRVRGIVTFTFATYNLIRLQTLMGGVCP
jgi:transposase